jgi:phasin
MAEATPTTAAPKAKAKPVAVIESPFEMPKFEMPKFEMPRFELPKFETPAAFREMAEKTISQAKDGYEKMKNAAEQASDLIEDTYTNASKGASDYGLKLLETARTNTNATFDLYGELLTAKSYAEVVEKTTAYMRSQFDTMTAQAKELADTAQAVMTKTAEPMKESLASFSKAA